MIKYFSNHTSLENRALQIWQILIGFAYERKITTYGEVAEILGYKGAGTMDRQLGHILHFCAQNKLPPLSVLVVVYPTKSRQYITTYFRTQLG